MIQKKKTNKDVTNNLKTFKGKSSSVHKQKRRARSIEEQSRMVEQEVDATRKKRKPFETLDFDVKEILREVGTYTYDKRTISTSLEDEHIELIVEVGHQSQ